MLFASIVIRDGIVSESDENRLVNFDCEICYYGSWIMQATFLVRTNK